MRRWYDGQFFTTTFLPSLIYTPFFVGFPLIFLPSSEYHSPALSFIVSPLSFIISPLSFRSAASPIPVVGIVAVHQIERSQACHRIHAAVDCFCPQPRVVHLHLAVLVLAGTTDGLVGAARLHVGVLQRQLRVGSEKDACIRGSIENQLAALDRAAAPYWVRPTKSVLSTSFVPLHTILKSSMPSMLAVPLKMPSSRSA